NTDIGLLVAVSSLVAAVASVPFGMLADRVKRTRVLGVTIVAWGVAMVWSATASTFSDLLTARLFLGIGTAAAGPIVASLVGDYFSGEERGRIYSYILTGELAGAGVGFAVTGDIAALSWRAAFVILAVPAIYLAWRVFRLPEPARGNQDPLRTRGSPEAETLDNPTDAQRLAMERGIQPDPDKVVGPEIRSMGIIHAARIVLSIRTNVILIVASACGYFYLSGIETFAVEYVKEQYGVAQAVANLLLFVLGAGAVLGTVFAGNLSDRLLKRGFLNARVVVPGVTAILASFLFLPAIFTRQTLTALPYLTFAAFMLSAQNPPIDAARLDIVPPLLWGRAEGIRTALRTALQSLAPPIFGVMSNSVLGHGRKGLQLTFAVTLVLLFASGVILLRAVRTYPRDVATASASRDKERSAFSRGAPNGGSGGAGPQYASPPLEVHRRLSQVEPGTPPPPPWPDPPPVPT
ncbi:MAG TPA: MFS transporter, partial [Acidimicrobiales bacterium]|nr:MFS transporter [Acidimicrobiales bacterium]